MELRVKNAIEFYIKAIEENKLCSNSFSACAIGTLIAGALNEEVYLFDCDEPHFDCKNSNVYNWYKLFSTTKKGTPYLKSVLTDDNLEVFRKNWFFLV